MREAARPLLDPRHPVLERGEEVGSGKLHQDHRVAEGELGQDVLAGEIGACRVSAIAPDAAPVGETDLRPDAPAHRFGDQVAEVGLPAPDTRTAGVELYRRVADDNVQLLVEHGVLPLDERLDIGIRRHPGGGDEAPLGEHREPLLSAPLHPFQVQVHDPEVVSVVARLQDRGTAPLEGDGEMVVAAEDEMEPPDVVGELPLVEEFEMGQGDDDLRALGLESRDRVPGRRQDRREHDALAGRGQDARLRRDQPEKADPEPAPLDDSARDEAVRGPAVPVEHVGAEPGKRGGGEVPGRRLGTEVVLVVAGHRDVDADGVHHLHHVRALGKGRHQRWREEVPTEGGDRVCGGRPLAPKERHQRSDPPDPALRLVLRHVVDVEEGDRRLLGPRRDRHREAHSGRQAHYRLPPSVHDASSRRAPNDGPASSRHAVHSTLSAGPATYPDHTAARPGGESHVTPGKRLGLPQTRNALYSQ